MVSWTAQEVQLLVTLVEQREALYDIANEDYTNRDIVWALWTDIARQLNKTPTACRDRWTSLRCVYRRIVNQQANSKTKRKIKWPWANMMTFLIPHLKTIQPRYGPDIEIDDTDTVITINDHKAYGTNDSNLIELNNYADDFELEDNILNPEDGEVEYLYDESGPECDPTEDPISKSCKRIKLEMPPQGANSRRAKGMKAHSDTDNNHSNYRNENVDNFLKLIQTPSYSLPKVSNTPVVHHYDSLAGVDADEMFFRSIIPDVKLLNQKDKGIFKLRVQQMLHDMLYPSKEETDQNGVPKND